MRQYIVLLNEKGASGCGMSWNLSTEYKQHAKIMEVVNNMMRWNKDAKSAYLLSNYTQQMCEMSTSDFGRYVKNNGMRLI